ncbi:DUF4278 domain-containing protein [Prochlorococcus marinus]|uniref:DUF4278 domain-containing protein n=1 Tax=Prochlorococcus marinus (strain MIT 9211) TaxID=93059 RepID=A9BE36_PROM4|nr:DUF4278 domain-containing protein [Prochlorococcus marinus]ABX08346.1 Conserved hypothetical protein [Prochlorococcus marinus str. MIT 9211]
MPTLTYRGKEYVQTKEAAPKQFVELTYRRNIYSTRRQEISTDHPILKYRGVDYQK